MIFIVAGSLEGYEWLAVDVDHPDWFIQEACLFTFIRGVVARDIAAVVGLDVEEVDGSAGNDDLLLDLMGGGKATFDAEGGWSVLYEDNGLPNETSERLAVDPRASEAVMVFTNVNSVVRFSHWREQRLLTSFEFPDERWGERPDELLPDMSETTGTTREDYSAAMDDGTYLARLMKLAQRLTAIYLGRHFLQRTTVLIAPPA